MIMLEEGLTMYLAFKLCLITNDVYLTIRESDSSALSFVKMLN